jgi:hypothetical protein
MFKKDAVAIGALMGGPIIMGVLVMILDAVRATNPRLAKAATFFCTVGFILFVVAVVQKIRKTH